MVRGSAMQLDGTKADIKLVESVVNEMMLTINNKGFIEPEEIRRDEMGKPDRLVPFRKRRETHADAEFAHHAVPTGDRD